MAYTVPTVADFTNRFPEFRGTSETVIQAALDEAVLYVDQSWMEPDYAPAIMYLTAHDLTTSGHSTGAVGFSGGFKSVSSGSFSITMADEGGGSYGGYETSNYGCRYLKLLRRNFPAVLVV